MEFKEVKMGTLPPAYMGGAAKMITFCVTEDCNLACKYCYMTGKNSKRRMDFEIAKKTVDYFLQNKDLSKDDAVVWDFIGGEPLLEIELIDKISDYIKIQMFELNHHWFNNYRFSFSTNGLLYHTEAVQNYIKKNQAHISIGMSVDGNKVKHDLQRIKTDGSGSYDVVVKNVPLWLQQFPNAGTKATFSHDDLIHLKDSIINLWSLGIINVPANVVFEDVWQEGDDELFENQLKELGDYILENELWNDFTVSFFDPSIGNPLDEESKMQNWCGAGKMVAVDCEGKLYPCIRFLDFSLSNKKGLKIGDIDNGIDEKLLEPFNSLTLEAQSTEECINCEIASGCAWCSGFNYDCSTTDSLFDRVTYICKMHKARVRANNYFWEKYTEKTGLKSPRQKSIEDFEISRKIATA